MAVMDQRERGTLLKRLQALEHEAEADERAGLLNPDADLVAWGLTLDPRWVPDEVAQCRANPAYFIDSYCAIESDRGQGVVPFHLFAYQRDVLRQWMEHGECIVLKARQLGITELAAALALWQVSFHPHTRVIVFSQDEPKAKEFAKKCRIAWEHLPVWLQVPLSNPQLTTTLELANGSRILPQAATERAARSLNCQLLILDEAAHQEYGQGIFEASAVTARSAGNRILVISTANGAGNFFHRLWLDAMQGDGDGAEGGGLGMHPIFLPWGIRPGRDAAWYAQATQGYDAAKKAQEYPARPEEAFILSGRPRFDLEALDAILEGCRAPAHTDLNGALRVWALPQPDRRYVIGADTAEGLATGDYSAAIVLDSEMGVDVAELHGHLPPEEFALYLRDLGVWYNTALLGVERNMHGHAVLLALASAQGYPNLYAHADYDASLGTTPRLGWPTTSATKPIMIDGLARAIRERRPFRNAALVGEARTYVVKDNGQTAASGTLHDDRVMAAAIAEQLRHYPQTTEEVVALEEVIGDYRVRIGRDYEPDPYQRLRRHLAGD